MNATAPTRQAMVDAVIEVLGEYDHEALRDLVGEPAYYRVADAWATSAEADRMNDELRFELLYDSWPTMAARWVERRAAWEAERMRGLIRNGDCPVPEWALGE